MRHLLVPLRTKREQSTFDTEAPRAAFEVRLDGECESRRIAVPDEMGCQRARDRGTSGFSAATKALIQSAIAGALVMYGSPVSSQRLGRTE